MTFDLDTPLIQLSNAQTGNSFWTVRNAIEGVQIFGGIGSGKTSGSGRMLALKYLAAGFGGLVLCVKPDEKDLWRDYAAKAGRADDLVIVEPGGGHFFNLLDYEAQHATGGMTENIVQVLKTVIRASDDKASGHADDPFWETALDMLIFHVIDLCKLAYGNISVQRMYDIVQSLPKPDQEQKASAFSEAFTAARRRVTEQIDAWEKSLSPTEQQAVQSTVDYEEAAFRAVPEARLLKFIDQ
ncbi:MAG TPA: hypothetical protein VMT55_03990, partial [Candidatus Sulfotelmatobacter sp.]|nr:hypothetical protein [Candidatus Sulfotelmatobacter sp.]